MPARQRTSKTSNLLSAPLCASSKTNSSNSKQPTSKSISLSSVAEYKPLNIPIEQVVYLNDDKVVVHEQGSNRYYINYPDTWRTISNQQLVLGVRAIRKFWDNLHMEISVSIEIAEVKNKSWNFTFKTNIRPDNMSYGNEKLFIDRINEQWMKFTNQLSESDKVYFTDVLGCLWTLKHDASHTNLYIIKTPQPEEFTVPYTVRIGSNISVSRDMKIYFRIEPYLFTNTKTNLDCLGWIFTARDNTFRYFNDRYLLAASFTGQTNYRYLGFTNTEFNPPKQYIIPSGETRFWIDVVTVDGREEVELDSRDLVVIEFQLLAVPYTRG